MPKGFRLLIRLSLLTGCLLPLTGCWLPQFRWGVDVEDVPKRQELLRQANDITVEDFFGRRMLNRERKAQVGNWVILHEDATYAYLGMPRFAGLFDDQRQVTEIARTPIRELDSRFPGWRRLDGVQMQQVLRQHLGKIPDDWEAELEGDFVRVTGTLAEDVPVNESPRGRPFELRLDKATFTKLN